MHAAAAAASAPRARTSAFVDPPGYARHRPETTLLYQLVEQRYPVFRELRAEAGRPLPDYVEAEFDAYLKCGRLEEGFLRLHCEQCHAEKLVAFSCKKRGFCPSCGARRMAEIAALLTDEILPERPLRLGAEPERAPAHDLHRRRVSERRCRAAGVPSGACADRGGSAGAGAAHRRARVAER